MSPPSRRPNGSTIRTSTPSWQPSAIPRDSSGSAEPPAPGLRRRPASVFRSNQEVCMASSIAPAQTRVNDQPPDGLSPEALLELYWHMLRSRRLDERAWTLHRQGKIVFHISAMGHEACQAGA